MNKLVSRINKSDVLLSGIACLIITIFNFINYFLVFLPATKGTSYLELNFLYTPSDIYSLIEKYGEIGRSLYISSSISLDMLVPLSASLFLICITIFLYKKVFADTKKAKGIIILGIFACLSDWTENILLMNTLKLYPKQYPELIKIAGVMTNLKYIFMICFIIIIGFITYRIVKKKKVN